MRSPQTLQAPGARSRVTGLLSLLSLRWEELLQCTAVTATPLVWEIVARERHLPGGARSTFHLFQDSFSFTGFLNPPSLLPSLPPSQLKSLQAFHTHPVSLSSLAIDLTIVPPCNVLASAPVSTSWFIQCQHCEAGQERLGLDSYRVLSDRKAAAASRHCA